MSIDLPVYVPDYRRLWRRRVRAQVGRAAADLLAAGAGLAGGVWLTGIFGTSHTVTTGILLGCALGAMFAGRSVRRRIRQARAGLPDGQEWPDLIRLPVRGETAVVVPPYHTGESEATTMGVVFGTLLYQELDTLDTLDAGPAGFVAVVLLGVAGASAVSRTMTWLQRPQLAMFTDRIEVGRSLGRYVVPWSAIGGAGELNGRLIVYLRHPDLVTRKGLVLPRRSDAVRAGRFTLSAGVLAAAVERFRQDEPARRAIASVPPRVVDDGTP
jgi:hypothetical protein